MGAASVPAQTPPRCLETARRVDARLQALLAERFLATDDAAECAQLALQWLARARRGRAQRDLRAESTSSRDARAGARRAACRRRSSSPLRLSRSTTASHPLVGALAEPRRGVAPRNGAGNDARRADVSARRLPSSSRCRSRRSAEARLGLLLVSRRGPATDGELGGASCSAQKLDQLRARRRADEGERKQTRERSLLLSIINAVTDPILLTDTGGRLLIANARALTLFIAHGGRERGAPPRRGA